MAALKIGRHVPPYGTAAPNSVHQLIKIIARITRDNLVRLATHHSAGRPRTCVENESQRRIRPQKTPYFSLLFNATCFQLRPSIALAATPRRYLPPLIDISSRTQIFRGFDIFPCHATQLTINQFLEVFSTDASCQIGRWQFHKRKTTRHMPYLEHKERLRAC
jgi:hypothetical protein